MLVPSRLSLLLTLLILGTGSLPFSEERSPGAVAELEPDPRKAKELARWPNGNDLARLKSVEGKPQWQVIRTLGHPITVEKQKDGVTRWNYPWMAACCVWIKNRHCIGTFYTAGY